MAHRIDAEHDQEGGSQAVTRLRPGTATPAPPFRPPAEPAASRPVPNAPDESPKPLWDKNNYGFWLTVCILISLLFSIVYRALG